MGKHYNKVHELRIQLMCLIQKKIDKKGVESDHSNVVVLKIDFSIDGDPSPRNITELGREYMYDSGGFHWGYSNLSVDDLALLVDQL